MNSTETLSFSSDPFIDRADRKGQKEIPEREARKGHSKASAFYLLIEIPEASTYIIHAPPHSRFFVNCDPLP
jgi:hypothetical protein